MKKSKKTRAAKRPVDGRTRAGKLLARKRAAMATARRALAAKRAVMGERIAAALVAEAVATIRAGAGARSAPGAYTQEVPR